MTKLVDVQPLTRIRNTHEVVDDFDWMISPHVWTTTLTDLGTATVGTGAGGILPLVPSDGTVADNDEAYITVTNKAFLFADDKPLVFEARIQFTEANADDANVMVGVYSATGANQLLDNSGGPPASYTGAVIFKVDGGTVWQCETSVAGTQTTTASVSTAGGSSYQTLRIEFKPFSSTQADVVFLLDGSPLLDSSGNAIKHTYTYTSAAAAGPGACVKNGDVNLETLNIDYIYCGQKR